MKEYKVESFKLSLSKNDEKLELFLNRFAKDGWVFKFMDAHYKVIFERDKNR
ncbi:hypothetical protein ACH3O9_01710 [Leeuwenhoekiella sp. A16]|uniref:hypothetical protein n=1 Tax=unclassified Leeuwenhoekiella TaxID=2615029 RepID=UPI003A813427